MTQALRNLPGAAIRDHATPMVESFFAAIGGDPLTTAFPPKRGAHPAAAMTAAPDADVPDLWHQIHARPREARAVGYVHIPFCENHCLFCGFYQNAWRPTEGPAYVDAVIAQMAAFAETPARDGPPLQAVYLGGGTPTALAARDLARLVEAIRRHLPLAPDCEITLEGRVHSFGLDKARAAFGAGVNRVSLGVQSFSEAIRRPLGRKATRAELIATLEGLVALDSAAIVVDLIYGLPRQTPADVAADVALCAQIGLHGLDLYSLNLIPGTPLLTAMEKGKMTPAGPSDLGRFFAAGEEAAEAEGWTPISTSHWQGGLRERNAYNLAVKTGAECLAFGAGGGGSLRGLSYRNTPVLAEFATARGAGLVRGLMRHARSAPVVNAVKAGMERGRLDLRPVEVALRRLCGAPSRTIEAHLAPLLAQWAEAGLLRPEHGAWRLTRAGRFWQVPMTARLTGWLGQHPDLKET